MHKLIYISNRIDDLNKLMAIIARWAVLLMLILGFWNVIGRYVGVSVGLNLSSNKFIESQWYLFDVIFLLGLGHTLKEQKHVRVDVLQGYIKEDLKIKLEILGTILLLSPFAIGVMAISIEPTIHSWFIGETSPDPNGLARYWVRSLIPLGFLLLSLQSISELIKSISRLRKNSLNNQIREK